MNKKIRETSRRKTPHKHRMRPAEMRGSLGLQGRLDLKWKWASSEDSLSGDSVARGGESDGAPDTEKAQSEWRQWSPAPEPTRPSMTAVGNSTGNTLKQSPARAQAGPTGPSRGRRDTMLPSAVHCWKCRPLGYTRKRRLVLATLDHCF